MSRDEQPIVVVEHVGALAGSEPVRLELFGVVDVRRRREAEYDFADAIGGGWTPEERAVHDELLGDER